MLKIDIDRKRIDGPVGKVEVTGGLVDICTDLSLAINDIYNSLRQIDEQSGDEFRTMFVIGLLDPSSPTWETRDTSMEGTTMMISVPQKSRNSGES
jgi:hypothetical protein